MAKKSDLTLQPVIFGSSDPSLSREISRMERVGKIRRIAPRIYSSVLDEDPATIIRRNILSILGNQFPGALLSHRTAFEYAPTPEGHVFATYTYTRNIPLPGVTIRFLKGPGPIEGDIKFTGELYVSQQERALLENLQVSRRPGPKSKTLALPQIEEKLEKIIRVNGEEAITRVRDRARVIAEQLNMPGEFEKLNKLISALLATHPAKVLTSPVAQARAFGVSYDEARITLFEKLFISLRTEEFKDRPDRNATAASFRNFAFFEAYFSNYIEGTVFEVDEAKKIIQTQQPLPARDEDSHDVLGTHQLVSSEREMNIIAESANHLLDILQYRHKILLSARPHKTPGEFKSKNNYAGQTAFVDMTLVRGTLIKGFEFYQALTHPFAKAAYMMFMVSEVHPFLDGNGRVARIMMNAELTSKGQSKIIIPTVYREDYVGALRKLTRQQDPGAYIRMLEHAHTFSENIYDDDMDRMQAYLQQCNAFLEAEQGKLVMAAR